MPDLAERIEQLNSWGFTGRDDSGFRVQGWVALGFRLQGFRISSLGRRVWGFERIGFDGVVCSVGVPSYSQSEIFPSIRHQTTYPNEARYLRSMCIRPHLPLQGPVAFLGVSRRLLNLCKT